MIINNKGFAITAVLYGLLILFSFLVGSYLIVLSSKKDRIENLLNEIENDYYLNNIEIDSNSPSNTIDNVSFPFTTPCTGVYSLSLTSSKSGETYATCSITLNEGEVISSEEKNGMNVLKIGNSFIMFSNYNCYLLNYNGLKSVNSITYTCV